MTDISIQLAKNRAWPLLERLNAALEAGEIDEAQWYREIAAVIVPAYLAGEDPRTQSGSSGDDADWSNYPGLCGEAVIGMGGVPTIAWLSAEKIGLPCLRRVEM